MEPTTPADPELVAFYEAAEREYLRSLPPEHFMEATDHAHQRKITLESFDVVHTARPDVQCFNELLVQYPRGKRKKLGQVVPDNFVLVHPVPVVARGSFNTPLQPVGPLLVLEYVSKYNKRKDYDDNFEKYEKELKIPYYLLFYPDNEELTLFRMTAKGYSAVRPNARGRYAVPELELEAQLLSGWVRFWFRGELVPLPAELLRRLNATEDQLAAAQAELARLRAELAKAKGQH
jgi:Uma2 family endonuclease